MQTPAPVDPEVDRLLLEAGHVCEGSADAVRLIEALTAAERQVVSGLKSLLGASLDGPVGPHAATTIRTWLLAGTVFDSVAASGYPTEFWRGGGVTRLASPIVKTVVSYSLERVAFHFPPAASSTAAPAATPPEHFFDFLLQEEVALCRILDAVLEDGTVSQLVKREALDAWVEGANSLFIDRYSRFLRTASLVEGEARDHLFHIVNVAAVFAKAHWKEFASRESSLGVPGAKMLVLDPEVYNRWLEAEDTFLNELLLLQSDDCLLPNPQSTLEWRRQQITDALGDDDGAIETLPYTHGLSGPLRATPGALEALLNRCRPLICAYCTGDHKVSLKAWTALANRIIAGVLQTWLSTVESFLVERTSESCGVGLLLRCIVGPLDFLLGQVGSEIVSRLETAVRTSAPTGGDADAASSQAEFHDLNRVLDDMTQRRDKTVRDVIQLLTQLDASEYRAFSALCSFATWERIEAALTVTR